MRKSRLVILPTKCLHQIGFLLLFLSCPVIGDWGRIQPESEASHKAIQLAREGSCGSRYDSRGAPFHILDENVSDECRFGATELDFKRKKLLEEKKNEFDFSDRRLTKETQIRERNERRLTSLSSKKNGQNNSRRIPIGKTYQRRVLLGTKISSEKKNPTRSSDMASPPSRRVDVSGKAKRFRRLYDGGPRNFIRTDQVHGKRNSYERIERLSLARRRQERQVETTQQQRGEVRPNKSAAKILQRNNSLQKNRKENDEQPYRRIIRRNNNDKREMEKFQNGRSITRLSATKRNIDRTTQLVKERDNRDEPKARPPRTHLQEKSQVRRVVARVQNQQYTLSPKKIIPRRQLSQAMIHPSNAHSTKNSFEENEKVHGASRKTDRRADTNIRRHAILPSSPQGIREHLVRGVDRRSVSYPYMKNQRIQMDLVEAIRIDKTYKGDLADYLALQKTQTNKDKASIFDNHDGLKVGEWTVNCLIGAVAYYLTLTPTKTS